MIEERSQHARHAGDLTGRLGDAVVLVDRHPEVDDPHEDHQEDDDHHRELDEALAALVSASACHGTGTDFVTVTEQPPSVAVTATDCDPPEVKLTVTPARSLCPTKVKAPDHA